MASYYVNRNAQNDGYHEVHVEGCHRMPDKDNREYLGEFNNCHEALQKAKTIHLNVDGCYYCCNPCHTR